MDGVIFHSLTDYITITLTFFSSLLALLMFFKYMIIRDKSRGEILLCAFIFCVFIWRLSDGLEYSELYRVGISSPALFVVITSISYVFTGPLIYFYGKFYIARQADTPGMMLPHLIAPCLLSSLLIAVSAARFGGDIGEEYARRVNGVLITAATVLLCAYVLFILINMLILLRKGSLSGKSFFAIIGTMALLVIGAGLAYLLGDRMVLAVLVLAALIVHLLFFDIITASLQIVQDEAARGWHRKSRLRDLDVDEIIERIELMMSWDRMYHDDRLSPGRFAGRLGITPRQLYEVLEEKIGLGFYPYINNYRIKEAREILARDKDSAVIHVARQVGFNSLSSFYTAFKKITGMSPGAYQKFMKK